MKKFIVCAALAAISGVASAQFAIGGQGNWSRYGSGGGSFIGLGINGSLLLREEYPIRLSVNYAIPRTTSETTTVNALSSTTTPSSREVLYKEKISLLNFWLDGQKFFGRGDAEDGGLYGLLGLGFTSAKVSYDVSAYDKTLYDEAISETESSVGQFGIRAALGYDKGFDFGNIFLEGGINLSANQANGQDVQVNLPSFLFVNFGVRHWFH
jgi:hypothetical protein